MNNYITKLCLKQDHQNVKVPFIGYPKNEVDVKNMMNAYYSKRQIAIDPPQYIPPHCNTSHHSCHFVCLLFHFFN